VKNKILVRFIIPDFINTYPSKRILIAIRNPRKPNMIIMPLSTQLLMEKDFEVVVDFIVSSIGSPLQVYCAF
jgi:hypothetical protein